MHVCWRVKQSGLIAWVAAWVVGGCAGQVVEPSVGEPEAAPEVRQATDEERAMFANFEGDPYQPPAEPISAVEQSATENEPTPTGKELFRLSHRAGPSPADSGSA